ncbi:hypothetical protein V5299_14635 [Celeribacter halophilus]
MEHAIRSHIRKNLEADPVRFRKMSQRLNDILKDFGQQWDQIIEQLQAIIDELRSEASEGDETISDIPEIYLPFLRTVLAASSADETTPDDRLHTLHEVTRLAVDRIIEEVSANRSLWSSFKMADQENLRSEIFEIIFDAQIQGFGVDEAEALADQLMQQAKANEDKLRAA